MHQGRLVTVTKIHKKNELVCVLNSHTLSENSPHLVWKLFMKSLVFVLTALLSSPVVYAEQTSPKIINCAEVHQLPDGNYSISMELMIKDGKAEVEQLFVDDGSETEAEIPKLELQGFIGCIVPLVSSEEVEFEE